MRGSRRARGPTAGFTLLELLVALAVLGFLMAGLQQGLRFGLAAWDGQTRVMERRGDIDAVDRALRRLLERAMPGGSGPLTPGLRGGGAALQWLTDLPVGAETGFSPQAEAALGVDAAGRLVLRWRTWRHLRPLAPPPPPTETVLLEGLSRLELSYWSRGTWLGAWTQPELPQLIRLRLVFPEGDARRWPDIVVAPRRERG